MSVIEEEGIVFEALNKTKFALSHSETIERPEVSRIIPSSLESLNSCLVGCMLYDFEKRKVVSSA